MGFDKSKFIDQFKSETRERIQALNLGLLKLEKMPKDRELLNAMMREAHSIKGASRMMGYKRIADITHKMEDGLQRALNGELVLSRESFAVLFKCLDALEPLLQDKVVWEDNGITRDFTEELCSLAEKIFLGKSPESQGAVPEPSKDTPKVPAVPDAASAPVSPKREEAPTLLEESLRVDIEKLNRLINLSGELLISKIRLEEVTKGILARADIHVETNPVFSGLVKELDAVTDHIDTLTEELQDGMMKVRMLPVGHLFNTFPRAMRDLAMEKGKEIDFEIRGEETQLDKAILDELKVPLMHLLRNSVDHGLELPEERKQKGKPACGKITLTAEREGSQVMVSVTDDGQGIDIDKVKEHAVAKGLVSRDNIGNLAQEQVFNLLFTPGFSTQEEVSDISGRGVGLDVVREMVVKLKGMVEVDSDPSRGTTFRIKLPLTLAITESLLAVAGSDTFAVPVDSVLETIRITPSDIKSVETKDVITVRGHIMPVVKLHDVFGLPAKGIMEKKFFPVIIVQSVEKRIGILVDALLGRQEIIGKSLGDPLKRVKDIAGATILGNGKVVLILDIPSIIHSAEGGVVRKVASKPKIATGKKKRTILLAEDVLSTAMLEKNILESVGYSVVIARDGKEALDKAAQESFDLVISDVLMPRMDGFELVTRLRKERTYKEVPIIIVTTRESDDDKRKGMEAGANAYLLKSDFTSEGLLETIERLLG
ncbi:MAG TPA: hybrid sensor histidine kinase/response regulator [Candidatus Omnitrophota bacterium]|nr:hybrid sensor histidine kinase/response regulator [Candidatus Omnitrophota bacterium]HPS36656.1 hybrid sensor histidine kinase/response regulator [Candidatus Omnitrophota bacterium]